MATRPESTFLALRSTGSTPLTLARRAAAVAVAFATLSTSIAAPPWPLAGLSSEPSKKFRRVSKKSWACALASIGDIGDIAPFPPFELGGVNLAMSNALHLAPWKNRR